MKHGKKLSRSQKEFLASLGLNPDNYLVERKLQNEIGFINKETNKVEKRAYENEKRNSIKRC